MKTVQLNHLERGRLKNLARTYVLEKGSLVLLHYFIKKWTGIYFGGTPRISL